MQIYLDDLEPGQVYRTEASEAVDADSIKAFASYFDPQPFHLDENAAVDTFFGGLAASGWHTAALTMRLIIRALPLAGGVIGAGADEFRWSRPVRPADVLQVECEVLDVRPSRSRPEQGTVRVRCITSNQKGEPVQSMIALLMAFRRASPAVA